MENMQTDDPPEILSKDELPAETEESGSVEDHNPRGKAQGHSSGATEIMEDGGIDQNAFSSLRKLINQVEPMNRDLFAQFETAREQLELNFATLQCNNLLKHEDKTDKETGAVKVSLSRPVAKPTDSFKADTSYFSGWWSYILGGDNSSESDNGNPTKYTRKRKLEVGDITKSVDKHLYTRCQDFCKKLKGQVQFTGSAKNSEDFLSIWAKFESHLEKMYGSENIVVADEAVQESAGSNVDKEVVAGKGWRPSMPSFVPEKPIKCVVHLKTSLDCDLHGVDQVFFASVKNQLSHHKPKLDLQVNHDDANQYRGGTSILVCPITSRLGSSVDSALRRANCTIHPRLALVLFHHQPPHLPLSVESERLLTDVQYSGIGCMVDVVFWQNEGMYDCATNRIATQKLYSFILKNSGVGLL